MDILASRKWLEQLLDTVKAEDISSSVRDEAASHLDILLRTPGFSAKECTNLLIRISSRIEDMALRSAWPEVEESRRVAIVAQITARQSSGDVARAAIRMARYIFMMDPDSAVSLLVFATERFAQSSPAGGLLGELRPFCTAENYIAASEQLLPRMDARQRLLFASALATAACTPEKKKHPLGTMQKAVVFEELLTLATATDDPISPWTLSAIEMELAGLDPVDRERLSGKLKSIIDRNASAGVLAFHSRKRSTHIQQKTEDISPAGGQSEETKVISPVGGEQPTETENSSPKSGAQEEGIEKHNSFSKKQTQPQPLEAWLEDRIRNVADELRILQIAQLQAAQILSIQQELSHIREQNVKLLSDVQATAEAIKKSDEQTHHFQNKLEITERSLEPNLCIVFEEVKRF
jgi:hypothetical protein